jgi:dinuclear metal center YbgI/SA1388 family protein
MKLSKVIAALEAWAPPALQEGYDNSGLLVGDLSAEITSAVVSLDCTEAVIQEAIDRGANLVIAHHPIVFGGLKRFTGRSYVERTVMMAIKHDIAIYAIHTNLDNVPDGVNGWLCQLLGIQSPRILAPKTGRLEKLVVFVPHAAAEGVRDAMFKAGAGNIGAYDECSYNLEGTGTFRGSEESNPHVGEVGKRHSEPETRIEVLVEDWKTAQVLQAMKAAHPYEEVAYDRYALQNEHGQIGSGMVGELEAPVPVKVFFDRLKEVLGVSVVKHTPLLKDEVQRIAVCGGSGFFLLNDAKRAGADLFVTSDVKYHQFFDADGRIVLADIGHWESEHRTSEWIQRTLNEKFPTFAVHLSDTNTNPVNYY